MNNRPVGGRNSETVFPIDKIIIIIIIIVVVVVVVIRRTIFKYNKLAYTSLYFTNY
jgi:hypothetical protein